MLYYKYKFLILVFRQNKILGTQVYKVDKIDFIAKLVKIFVEAFLDYIFYFLRA